MISFTYVEPREVGEVLETLARYGDDAKLIAGGTGLINLMKQNLVQPAYLIGLRRIRGLDSIKSRVWLGDRCFMYTEENRVNYRSRLWILFARRNLPTSGNDTHPLDGYHWWSAGACGPLPRHATCADGP
jgi:hypothetical protein